MSALIEASELTRVYGHGASEVVALDHVSLAVEPGERFGIVGESGSGKSTLIRLLAALDQPTSGEVYVDGQRADGRPERELGFVRRCVQLVFQDPHGSLNPRMKVGRIIAEPLRSPLMRDRSIDPAKRVAELLDAVGLDPADADRYPHEFSGGQRQRIAIARALAPRPRVLIADEAVSALDVSVRAQILNLLNDLVDAEGLTLIFVSHDLRVVRHTCRRAAVLQHGVIVETGDTRQLFESPQHPYTQALVGAIPQFKIGAARDDARPSGL